MNRSKFLKILGMLTLAPIVGGKVLSELEKKKEPEKSYIADGILTHIPHQNILQNTNSDKYLCETFNLPTPYANVTITIADKDLWAKKEIKEWIYKKCEIPIEIDVSKWKWKKL